MNLNWANPRRRRGSGADVRRGPRRLRPTVVALEGRELLSTFAVTGRSGASAASGLTVGDVGARGGGPENGGTLSAERVVLRGNAARLGSGRFGVPNSTLLRRVLTRRAFTTPVLADTFNGTGGVPRNWAQILDPRGTVTESPHNVKMTDTTGIGTGIASTLPSSVFNPQNVVTTIQAQVNSTSVKPVGNAIVGLVGMNAQGQMTGVLGAGIDSTGVVFVIEQDPTMSSLQTVIAGVDSGYKGGPVALKLVIQPNAAKPGVLVTAGSFSATLPFSTALHGFSLAKAFGTQAIPALVAASQPNASGGWASFGSIQVSTAVKR